MKKTTYKISIFLIGTATEAHPTVRTEVTISPLWIKRHVHVLATEWGYYAEPIDGRVLYYPPRSIRCILYEEKTASK